METAEKNYEAERRSTRIRAQIPLQLRSLDPAAEFSEPCHTLILNAQGCGVRLGRVVEPGLEVELGLPTGLTVKALVANCVPLGHDGKYWLVGLALEEPGNVWGLSPAPADWGEPNAVAHAVSVSPSAKKDQWPFSQFSSRGEFHPGRR